MIVTDLKSDTMLNSSRINTLGNQYRQIDTSSGSLRDLIVSLRRAKDLGTIRASDTSFASVPSQGRGSVGPNDPVDFFKVTIEARTGGRISIDELAVRTSGPGKGVNVLSFSLDDGLFSPNVPLAASNNVPLKVGNDSPGPPRGFLYNENDGPAPVARKVVYIQVTPVNGKNDYQLTITSRRRGRARYDNRDKQDSLDLFYNSIKQARNLGTVKDRTGLQEQVSVSHFGEFKADFYRLTVNPGANRFGAFTIKDSLKESSNDIRVTSFVVERGAIFTYPPYRVPGGEASYLPWGFSNTTNQPTQFYTQISRLFPTGFFFNPYYYSVGVELFR